MTPRWIAWTLLVLAACSARSAAAPGESPSSTAEAEQKATVREAAPAPTPAPTAAERADALAHAVIILDGHVDLPMRLSKEIEQSGTAGDVTQATTHGDFDVPRARMGGLDAPFMSIYVPAHYEAKGAKKLADELIDLVEELVARAPDALALARSPAEVRAAFAARKIALPLGMENGAPIEHDLANLRHFHARGIRYVTLAHSRDNHISDSSYDDRHTHKGLSMFGKQVVEAMNELGIMIDVSHVSDDAFWQVIRLSQVPVIASHSSCRHFTPGFERNMSDAMIVALAEHGGVIQINFGSTFLTAELNRAGDERRDAIAKRLAEAGITRGDPRAEAIETAYDAEHPRAYATVEQVADHIEHVIDLVGIEHVGLGSDFEGVGDSLPVGLKDVSAYPNLLRVLIERGHDEAALTKLCGENVLRVWQAVEDYAAAKSK